MNDEEYERLLQDYLTPEDEANEAYKDVRFDWIEGRPEVGVDHFHDVTKEEVMEAILRVPPEVRVKRQKETGRLVFYGATRQDRWIIVVCEEALDATNRVLTPITAFEPDRGENYWNEL